MKKTGIHHTWDKIGLSSIINELHLRGEQSHSRGSQNHFFGSLTRVCILAALMFSFLLPIQAAPVGSRISTVRKRGESVGLVLSGGGAKGIAHVGVIKALEDNEIPIDYVTGTSMGAIVGSLYSCGWSPEEMIHFFTSRDFQNWSKGIISQNLTYYINNPVPSPKWVTLNINPMDTTGMVSQILPAYLVSPLPMNIEFLKLYAPYSLQSKENFNDLFVPFRCVASDVYHKHKIVFKDGDLGTAVRASMSFPFVFKPIEVGGVLLFDGGIYDNFPVDVMEEDFNPDFIIGVSVSSPDKKPKEGDIYSQLEDMIIQNNNYSLPAEKGVKIQVPVLDFGVLDFDKAETIYEIGYQSGMAMVDSIKSRITSRRDSTVVESRRHRFDALTPVVEFDSVAVRGLHTAEQARYLEYLFNNGKKKPFGLTKAQTAYYRAVTDGTLANLYPEADLMVDGKNILRLKATMKRPWTVGVGGWITSTANSMLFLDLGYHTLSFNSLDVSLAGWIGQSYLAGMFSGKFSIRSSIPSFIELEGVLSQQKYYDSQLLFYDNSTPTFITEVENFVRLSYDRATGMRGKMYVGLGYGYKSDSYFPTNALDYSKESKDVLDYHVLGMRSGWQSSMLNDELYPTSGYDRRLNMNVSYERTRYTPAGDKSRRTNFEGRFRSTIEGYWKQFFKITKDVRLGLVGNALGTLQGLNQNYTATIIHAPAFAPTPSTKSYFNEAFRSDNYVAAGLIPVWNPIGKLQLRGDFYAYSPIRNLHKEGDLAVYDGWFRKVDFIGEVASVYNFPFASLSIYVNYLSYPRNNWNVGINFGLLFHAPKFLR